MKTLLTSKTTWAIVALFIISGTNGIMGLIPVQFSGLVQAVLGIMAVYFHVDSVQTLKGTIKSLGGVA